MTSKRKRTPKSGQQGGQFSGGKVGSIQAEKHSSLLTRDSMSFSNGLDNPKRAQIIPRARTATDLMGDEVNRVTGFSYRSNSGKHPNAGAGGSS